MKERDRLTAFGPVVFAFGVAGCAGTSVSVNVSPLATSKVMKVAVLDIVTPEKQIKGSYLGGRNWKAGLECRGQLTNAVVMIVIGTERYRTMERSGLTKVLAEQGLQMSAITDERSAVEAGRLLGAEAVVVGNGAVGGWSDLAGGGTSVTLDFRLVGVESGEIIWSVRAEKWQYWVSPGQLLDKLSAAVVRDLRRKLRDAG